MGRVDDAMRRAAGAALVDASVSAEAETKVLAEASIDALAREPFPIEMPGHRPPRKPEVARESKIRPDAIAHAPGAVLDGNASSLLDRVDEGAAEKLVVDDRMPDTSREQYRRLAALLHAGQEANGLKVVMIGSAVPGEGKTLTASNLALTLSESYQRRVLLIDADLRRPSMERLFGLKGSAGLADGLVAHADARLDVRQISAKLSLLPAGRPTGDPMARLTSDRMRRLIDDARQTFDWVVIDTPPIVLLPDAHLLAAMADGVVLVIRADATPHELVKRAADAIGRDRILGVVLNSAQQIGSAAYYGYYTGYQRKAEIASAPTT